MYLPRRCLALEVAGRQPVPVVPVLVDPLSAVARSILPALETIIEVDSTNHTASILKLEPLPVCTRSHVDPPEAEGVRGLEETVDLECLARWLAVDRLSVEHAFERLAVVPAV